MTPSKLGKSVISIPAQSLPEGDVPGSLFDAKLLEQMLIPDELRRAVMLVSRLLDEPLCLVRPEMFTHGASRRWLDNKLQGVRHHVCISDGGAIKVISGLNNHLFLYGLGRHKRHAALRNISRWAPELFAGLKSQINTFHGVWVKGRFLQPPTQLLLPETAVPGVNPDFYEFYLHRPASDEGAKFIVDSGEVAAPSLAEFKEVIYVPLTESNALNEDFTRLVASVVAAAYFNPHQVVVIRLPNLSDTLAGIVQRVAVAVNALHNADVAMPRVPAKNVLLASHDLPESFFAGHEGRVSMIFDETFDYWQYTKKFYALIKTVRFLFGGDERALQRLVQGMTEVFGRLPATSGTEFGVPPFPVTWNRRQPELRVRRG